MQVSPSELEASLLSPSESSVSSLLEGVAIAGVSTFRYSRTGDELVPRAWVVPSTVGRRLTAHKRAQRVEDAVKERMDKHKWLGGGVEIIDEYGSCQRRRDR